MRIIAIAFKGSSVSDPETVAELLESCREQCQTADRYVVMSDRPLVVGEWDDFVPLAHSWPAEFAFLEMFRPVFEPGAKVLGLTPRVEIEGDLDPLFGSDNPLAVLDGSPTEAFAWSANDLADVYRSFARNPKLDTDPAEFLRIHRPHPARFQSGAVRLASDAK